MPVISPPAAVLTQPLQIVTEEARYDKGKGQQQLRRRKCAELCRC